MHNICRKEIRSMENRSTKVEGRGNLKKKREISIWVECRGRERA